ncbi:uncharacterized protein [Miscanthus floridulus]|uniref:uncharacterized protein n=1 Tax=Miscanthus floridulus TaxID=154761 RepID=UPI00345B0810
MDRTKSSVGPKLLIIRVPVRPLTTHRLVSLLLEFPIGLVHHLQLRRRRPSLPCFPSVRRAPPANPSRVSVAAPGEPPHHGCGPRPPARLVRPLSRGLRPAPLGDAEVSVAASCDPLVPPEKNGGGYVCNQQGVLHVEKSRQTTPIQSSNFIWDDGGNQAGVLSVQDDNDVPKAETLRAFCARGGCRSNDTKLKKKTKHEQNLCLYLVQMLAAVIWPVYGSTNTTRCAQ